LVWNSGDDHSAPDIGEREVYISLRTPSPFIYGHPPNLESPNTMTVDMEKCKRIVQYFWDPEPKNEEPATVIWCLGREYVLQTKETGDCELGQKEEGEKHALSNIDPQPTNHRVQSRVI
jgi:hypothetical protein